MFGLTFYHHKRTPIISTENGSVQGIIAVSRDGRHYDAYVSIPFALPPIGSLRFEAPVPAKPWKGILKTNRLPPDSFQFDAMIKGKYMGSEDSLYLNVFVPKLKDKQPTDKLLPVMIWIHGGGFMCGGSKMHNPKYLLDEDVIICTLNYRLGPLGFLNTGDEFIRGNMGLKDQNLAMKWIVKNIESFGGDSKNVTLFGESAGAGSTHYHMISPASRDIFQKAILQSGGVNCPWAFTENPRQQAINYAKKIGCPTENMSEMVKHLKQMKLKDLFAPLIEIMTNSPFTEQAIFFAPSIETVQKDDTFLTENPRLALAEGRFCHIPVIMGVTSGEGALKTARLEVSGLSLKEIDANWNHYCPIIQNYDPKRTDISDKLKKYYFNEKPFTTLNRSEFFKRFTKMISDGWFYHALHTAASHHSKVAPVYLYYYDYEAHLPGLYSAFKAVKTGDLLSPGINIALSAMKDSFKKFFGMHGPHEYGIACHGDDLAQIWRLDPLLEVGRKSKDSKFSKALVKSFTDFAKDWNNLKFDGAAWPQTNSESSAPFRYMRLNKTGQEINEPFADRLPFWDSLNIRS